MIALRPDTGTVIDAGPRVHPTGPRSPARGRIRTISYRHAHAVGELLAAAFHHEPVSRWLVPDPDERPHVLSTFFTTMATSAFTTGSVDVIVTDHDIPIAAAVWFDRTRPLDQTPGADLDGPANVPDEEHGDAEENNASDGSGLRRDLVDSNADRWTLLDQVMTTAHPHQPHEYLMLAGVHPAYQGQGWGTRLLNNHHAALDATGTPAYLEATSRESRALYTRLGYHDHGNPLPLAQAGHGAGLVLWPMMRPSGPAPAAGPDGSSRPPSASPSRASVPWVT